MSLYGTYDIDNIFAQIVRGDMPSVKVFEDDEHLAFMDVFPVSEGHILIIPKNTDARNLLELDEGRIGPLMAFVQKLAKAVEKGLKPDGIRIAQFNGACAGQTVFHLHFHIIPVYDGQTNRAHATGEMATKETLTPIARRIMNALE